MGNLLYIIIVVLLVLWTIGYVGFNAGAFIHFLLIFALAAALLRIVQGRKMT